MAITSIGDQKTPGRPVEITFAAETGTPSANQEVLLIGRKDAISGSESPYSSVVINNVADIDAATEEANEKFGEGSELALMVIAAVRANAAEGRSNFPALKAIPLASTDNDYGPADEAITAAKRLKAEFIATPFDGQDETLRNQIRDAAAEMSGAQRVHNNQFGTMAVIFNRSEEDPGDLDQLDSQFLAPVALRDTGVSGDAPAYSIAEVAAAYAAVLAGGVAPFNPNDDRVIGGLAAPALQEDWYTVGAGLETETILNKGWTPLKVLPNGKVAIVRARTARTKQPNGVTDVTAYFDVEDFQVLYFWRKTIFTRLTQPDLVNVKASAQTASLIKAELIRLAKLFETQGMFQSVDQLAKLFIVQRSTSDRSRFDVKTPVNVIPGLHVVATNIEATTQFDTITV